MLKEPMHLFPAPYRVERACSSRGRPSYRWVWAYCQIGPGFETGGLPRREWQAVARRDGVRCIFHPDRETALRAALARAEGRG